MNAPVPGRIARAISNVHPLVYAVVYLFLVPAFATVYYLMPPGSFYAPDARLEPSVTADLGRAAATIEKALKRSTEDKEISINGAKLTRLLLFNPLSPNGSSLAFTIMGEFQRSQQAPDGTDPGKGDTGNFAINLPASIPAHTNMLIGPKPDETANIVVPIVVDVSRHPADFRAAETGFYEQLLTTPFPFNTRGLVMTRAEDGELETTFMGLEGNPTAVSQGFPRMLYFSAIVITTVGFGDIVPMIPEARLTVGIQALFGIILAGLFLNAVAHRAAKQQG
jgi:hypothetical protein